MTAVFIKLKKNDFLARDDFFATKKAILRIFFYFMSVSLSY